jgi:hypothetical protein
VLHGLLNRVMEVLGVPLHPEMGASELAGRMPRYGQHYVIDCLFVGLDACARRSVPVRWCPSSVRCRARSVA